MQTIYHLSKIELAHKDELLNAISSEHGFSKWWTDKVEKTADGNLRFHFPGDYYKDFKPIEASKNLVSYKCLNATPEWIDTIMKFELKENEGMIELHFTHSGWEGQTSMYGICNYHWALYIKSLVDLLTTGKGNPTRVS